MMKWNDEVTEVEIALWLCLLEDDHGVGLSEEGAGRAQLA